MIAAVAAASTCVAALMLAACVAAGRADGRIEAGRGRR